MQRPEPVRGIHLPVLRLPGWLSGATPETSMEARRIRSIERDLGLPVKLVMVALLCYYLFFSRWFEEMSLLREGVLEVVQLFFGFYLVLNVVGGILLAGMDELPFGVVRETVLVLCIVDGFFLGALTMVTGGFDSILFWMFLVLIVRNAISVAEGGRQLFVNVVMIACYLGAGGTELLTKRLEISMLDPLTLRAIYPEGEEVLTESVLLRAVLLVLLTLCCYGVEILYDRQRQREEESREFDERQRQLQSAGRLAAEIAHRLKNPLGIINNAAYTLQRTVKEGKTITQQIQIIREEVGRSDRIITELMGYARLVEGRVERLNVAEELDAAIEQVFPPAVKFEIQVHRRYAPALPTLHMLRSHFSEILVNILQNAREAMGGKGNIGIEAKVNPGYLVEIVIDDDGPGIAPAQLERIFEPYFSTKDKGTGLGLAIVKHNVELYGGTILVESELGKGTKFTLDFPARASIQLRR